MPPINPGPPPSPLWGLQNLTATGTNQGSALTLVVGGNVFSHVAVGTGAVLPGPNQFEVMVFNGGENTLLIYPNFGDRIHPFLVNQPISLPPGQSLVFISFDNELTPAPRVWRIEANYFGLAINDGTTSVNPVGTITVSGGTVTDLGNGDVELTISGGGGGIGTIVTANGLTANGVNDGTLTANGTIGLETLAAASLFGRQAGSAGPMGAITTGFGLSINTGGTLLSNWQAGTVTALAPGGGLTITTGTLQADWGGTAGIVNSLGTGLTNVAGVLSATGSGTVTKVVAQGGPFIANGTISTTGTINNSITSLTAHGIVLGEGTSAVAATAAGTNGQLLIGQTGADPAFETMSGDATISNTGAVTLAASGVTATTYGDATHVGQFTVNAKGIITAATAVAISGSSLEVTDGTADVTGVTKLTFAGATVTGNTPNATVTVTGGGGGVTSVNVSGGTTGLTASGGPITTSGTITLAGTLAQANGGTGVNSLTGLMALQNAGSVAITGGTITGMGTPVAGSDVANKTYVDNVAAALNPAVAVQAVTTAAANTSAWTYNNGASGIGATFTGPVNTAITIDGVLFNTIGMRLLISKDTQSPSGAFNGVYSLTAVQTVGTGAIFTRALDYDQPSDINNTGAIPDINHPGASWLLISSVTTVGTDPLTYTQFSIALANQWNAGSVSAIANSLSLNAGTIGISTLAATSLLGNSGTVAATPTAIAIGNNLTLTAGTLSGSAGGGGGIGTIIASGITNTASSVPLAIPSYTLPTFTTWLNQNSATITANTNGPIVLESSVQSGTNDSWSVRYKSLSAGSFSLRANISMIMNTGTAGPHTGLILTDGTFLSCLFFDYVGASFANQLRCFAARYTNPTTFGTTFGSLTLNGFYPMWGKIHFDGASTYDFSVGMDGFSWTTIASTATLGFTPNGIGIGIDTGYNTTRLAMSLNSWDGA